MHHPVETAVATAAALVALAFALSTFERWQARRRRHEAAWSVALLLFAVAAGALAAGAQGGWSGPVFRVFYLFGAITNVAWLALGTVFIVAPRFGRVALLMVLALCVVAAYAVFASPVNIAVAVDTGKGYPDGSLPRILAAIGSGVGSLVLIGGALWSAWVFLRRRNQGRRAVANAVIAIGVFIVAAGGTVAFTGASGILELTNLVGVSVMFVGFLLI